jgi:hypothetical protein
MSARPCFAIGGVRKKEVVSMRKHALLTVGLVAGLVSAGLLAAVPANAAPVAGLAAASGIVPAAPTPVALLPITPESIDSVARTIPVGANPSGIAISPDGSFAYVVSAGARAIYRIDTASGAVTATIPLDQAANVSRVAFSPDGSFAYVTAARSGAAVVRVDTATGTVTPVSSPTNTRDVVISPDGTRAYVTFTSTTRNVAVIDTATGATISQIGPGSGLTSKLALSPDGTRLYLAYNRGDGAATYSLYRYDTGTLAAVNSYSLTSVSYAVAVGPDGSAYVVQNGIMRRFSPTGGQNGTVSNSAISGALAVSPDGTVAFVGAGGTLSKIDLTGSMSYVRQLATGSPVPDLTFSPDGTFVLASNSGAGRVVEIAAVTPPVTDVQVDNGTSPVTVSGQGVPGATVDVTDSAGNPLGSVVVAGDGSWSLQLTGSAGPDQLINLVQTADGNAASLPVTVDVSETVGPVVYLGSDTSSAPPVLNGTGVVGAVVQATDSTGAVIGTATVQPDGTWTMNLSSFPQPDRQVTFVQTLNGITSDPATATIDVVVPAPEMPVVDWDAVPVTMTGQNGIPGATITATNDAGDPVGTATVGPDGSWTIELADGIDPNTNIQLVQTMIGIDSLPTEFVLADAPAIDPAVAVAALGLGALGLGAIVLYRRRRHAVVTAGPAGSGGALS